MKLVHSELENQICFNGNINVLVIENKRKFFQINQELYNQTQGLEGFFVLSHQNVEIPFAKEVLFVTDLLHMTQTENKKLLNKLLSLLNETAINEDNYVKTLELKGALITHLQQLAQDLEFPVALNSDFELSAILKALNIRFEFDESKSLLEQIIDYFTVSNQLAPYKLIIFYNLKTFLSQEDLQALYQYFRYNQMNVLLLENASGEKMEQEEIIIIDNDLCELIG